MYGFHQAQLLSNMAIGIFTLRQQLRGLLSGNWPGDKTSYVEYLVVGGGGGAGAGGASYGGSGGGAGGVLTGILPVTAGATNNVTVGGGGAGGTAPGNAGTQGVNSVLNSLTAVGGGYGVYNTNGGNGGSGGGGGNPSSSGGQGVFGQGNKAGAGNTNRGGVGGGGAGTVSVDSVNNSYAVPSTGFNGGAGISSVISGTVTPYGGGGAGGGGNGGTGGTGGVGGGGNGSGDSGATAGGTGQANTGGGGGGGSNNSSGTVYSAGGAGGSGIVIISYPDIYPALTTGGSTSPTVSTSGSGSMLFNGSTDFLTSAATQVIPATADFTIEAWVYLTSFTGNPVIVGQGSAANAGRSFFYVTTGGALGFFSGDAIDVSSSGTISLNTWTYVAFTKASNVGTFYINGTSAGGGSVNNAIQNINLTVGGLNPAWTTRYFTGYISNLRISNIARTITSTPTAPFSSVTNTNLLLNTVSGSVFADSSSSANTFTATGTPAWNQLSPFATGLGYKNRVYTWVNGGGAGTSATGTFTV